MSLNSVVTDCENNINVIFSFYLYYACNYLRFGLFVIIFIIISAELLYYIVKFSYEKM